MDFLFRGDDPDEKIDEVFGRDPKFDPADYEDEIPGARSRLSGSGCLLSWVKVIAR